MLNASSQKVVMNLNCLQQEPCKPIPPKFGGWQIHTPNLGGGVSEIPYFTVLLECRPQDFRGEVSPPKFRGYGLTGNFVCAKTSSPEITRRQIIIFAPLWKMALCTCLPF